MRVAPWNLKSLGKTLPNFKAPSPGLTIRRGCRPPYSIRSRSNLHPLQIEGERPSGSAFLKTLLVMLHALLRNARADQRTDEATRGAACTSTGQRGRQAVLLRLSRGTGMAIEVPTAAIAAAIAPRVPQWRRRRPRP